MPPKTMDGLLGKVGKQLEGFKVTRQLLNSGARAPEPDASDLTDDERALRQGLAWQRSVSEALLRFSGAAAEALHLMSAAQKELSDAGLAQAGLEPELVKAFTRGLKEARRITAQVATSARAPLEAHQQRLTVCSEKLQRSNAAAAEMKHYEEKVARLKRDYDEAMRQGRNEKYAACQEMQSLDANKRKLQGQAQEAKRLRGITDQALKEVDARRGQLCNIAQDIFFGAAEALQKVVKPLEAPVPSAEAKSAAAAKAASAVVAPYEPSPAPSQSSTPECATPEVPAFMPAERSQSTPWSSAPWPSNSAGDSQWGSSVAPAQPSSSSLNSASSEPAAVRGPWGSSAAPAGDAPFESPWQSQLSAPPADQALAPAPWPPTSSASDSASAPLATAPASSPWPSQWIAEAPPPQQPQQPDLEQSITPHFAQALLETPNLLDAVCKRYFKRYDQNESGKLELHEAVALVEDLQEGLAVPAPKRPNEQQVRALIARYEVEGNDSCLSEEQFAAWFTFALRATLAKSVNASAVAG